MSASNSSPSAPPEKTTLETPELTEAQVEFMEDLRISLIQMKNGEVMPALEALSEIRRELQADDDAN